jgi:hypothetical protein
MKLFISHGASPGNGTEPYWFIVDPRQRDTETSVDGTVITTEMAVNSLLAAGRTVYELDVIPGTGQRRCRSPQRRSGRLAALIGALARRTS